MMGTDAKRPKPRCPRCRSTRLQRRLDGSRACGRCGQRIANDGRLIPSHDRRGDEGGERSPQLTLL